MADFLRRLRRERPDEPARKGPGPLTEDRILFGYRMNWTRTAMTWDADRRALIAARVDAIIHSSDFEQNALERRFRVEGLDDQAHSGASLIALADVIRALDKFEFNDDNQP